MKQAFRALFVLLLFFCVASLFAGDGIIDAALSTGDSILYLFDDTTYYLYDLNNNRVVQTGAINGSTFPGVTFTSFDAALNWGNGKAFFFKGNEYTRFDLRAFRADPGYPKRINNATWPGLPYSQIDAAVNWGNGKVYFFSRGTYTRYDIADDRAETGYPQMISNRTWRGLSFSTADAAVQIDRSFCYIFSKKDYSKFDIAANRTFPEYPKSISNNWVGFGGGSTDGDSFDTAGTGFQTESFTVDLSPYSVRSPNSVLGSVLCAAGSDGSLVMAFQEGPEAKLAWYNSGFTENVRRKNVGEYWFSDIMLLEDGSTVLLLGKDINNTYIEGYPNALYIMKLDPSGREVFTTYIFGGNGHGPGQSWFDGRSKAQIAYNGSRFGVYFEVQKNFADPGAADDIHNGDMFIAVDGSGRLIEETRHFWTASHSSTIQVQALDNGEFSTMTIGDAYPYGLQVYNRDRDTSFLAWPPEEDYVPYEEVNSTNAAGILEAISHEGPDLIAFMGTVDHPNIGWKTKVDPLFLKFAENGNILVKKYLEVDPTEDSSTISVVEMGGGYLVGWGAGNDYDRDWEAQPVTAALIDRDGNFIIAPKELDLPFGTYSSFIKTGPDTVVWFLAENGGSLVEGLRLTVE